MALCLQSHLQTALTSLPQGVLEKSALRVPERADLVAKGAGGGLQI